MSSVLPIGLATVLLALAQIAVAQEVVPTDLLARWTQGAASAVSYYDPSTGAWAPPSGSGFSYTFYPDGRYVYTGLMQSSLYGCTMSLFSYQEGSFYTDAQVLMLVPALDKIKSEDTCNDAYNYQRDVPPEREYFIWRTGPDAYGGVALELTRLILMPNGLLDLDDENPEPSVFYKED